VDVAGTMLGPIAVVGLRDGTGVAHPTRSAQNEAMANIFIDKQTVSVPDRLRKPPVGMRAPANV
jgi:hypothetical protein